MRPLLTLNVTCSPLTLLGPSPRRDGRAGAQRPSVRRRASGSRARAAGHARRPEEQGAPARQPVRREGAGHRAAPRRQRLHRHRPVGIDERRQDGRRARRRRSALAKLRNSDYVSVVAYDSVVEVVVPARNASDRAAIEAGIAGVRRARRHCPVRGRREVRRRGAQVREQEPRQPHHPAVRRSGQRRPELAGAARRAGREPGGRGHLGGDHRAGRRLQRRLDGGAGAAQRRQPRVRPARRRPGALPEPGTGHGRRRGGARRGGQGARRGGRSPAARDRPQGGCRRSDGHDDAGQDQRRAAARVRGRDGRRSRCRRAASVPSPTSRSRSAICSATATWRRGSGSRRSSRPRQARSKRRPTRASCPSSES